jgi:hypothetical protein
VSGKCRKPAAATLLQADTPAPLADRLPPRLPEDMVSQDHLVGPHGTRTRMLKRDMRECPECSAFADAPGTLSLTARAPPAELLRQPRTHHGRAIVRA